MDGLQVCLVGGAIEEREATVRNLHEQIPIASPLAQSLRREFSCALPSPCETVVHDVSLVSGAPVSTVLIREPVERANALFARVVLAPHPHERIDRSRWVQPLSGRSSTPIRPETTPTRSPQAASKNASTSMSPTIRFMALPVDHRFQSSGSEKSMCRRSRHEALGSSVG